MEHAQEGQLAQMSASVRARPIGNSVERDCITKCKEQIHTVVELPACLPKLVKAEVIAEATGWSPKHVLCLAKIRSRPERNQILNLEIAPKLNFWCENAVVPRGNSAREKNGIEPRTW